MSRILLFGGALFALVLVMVACGADPDGAENDPSDQAAGDVTDGTAADDEDEDAQEEGDFPERDVRLVVPFSPGGGFDTQARLIAPHLERHLPGDVNVVVDNQPGGDGLQAPHSVYAADPDGHTIMQSGVKSQLVQQFINPDVVRYDMAEFAWIGQYQQDIRGLGVHPDLGLESWDDFLALAEERPIRFGTAGAGSPPGTEAAALAALLDFPANMIDYPGSNEVQGGFARDEVDAVVLNYTSLLRWVEDGDAEILLVWSDQRGDYAPDVPTAVEAGVPQDDYDTVTSLPVIGTPRAFAAPPGTPDDVLQVLRDAFWDAMEDEEFIAEVEQAQEIYNPLPGEEVLEMIESSITQIEGELDLIQGLYTD